MSFEKCYDTKSLPIGIEIFGLNLSDPTPLEVIEKIKEDVTKHRLLVFRNQGQVTGNKHVEISKWFGDIDNTTFAKHPASPSNEIFRVSNDPEQGCTRVGMSGWHIDGTFRPNPYAYSIYHMYVVPNKGGDTMFIPLTDLIEKLPAAQRARWERLWMVSDLRGSIIHPLIYPHSKTGRPTLCFHLGMTNSFVFDYSGNVNSAQFTDEEETKLILREIKQAIKDYVKAYSHQWSKKGDFIISDNLAVGHMAGPIPSSVEEAGLRVLHRTTVVGSQPPGKSCDVEYPNANNCAY